MFAFSLQVSEFVLVHFNIIDDVFFIEKIFNSEVWSIEEPIKTRLAEIAPHTTANKNISSVSENNLFHISSHTRRTLNIYLGLRCFLVFVLVWFFFFFFFSLLTFLISYLFFFISLFYSLKLSSPSLHIPISLPLIPWIPSHYLSLFYSILASFHLFILLFQIREKYSLKR